MLPLVNIHTHRKPQAREWALRYAWLPATAQTLDRLPYHTCVGVHPWWAHRYADIERNTRLYRALAAEKVLAVGEIGLDRVHGPDFALQTRVFEAQWKAATEHNLPVVVHCVRAYADMLAYAKRSQVPLIFHDYRGNTETTAQLLRFDACYFSLGKILFRNPEAARALLKQIPMNRLFLETDTMPVSIQTVYDTAAALPGIDMEELALRVWENRLMVVKK